MLGSVAVFAGGYLLHQKYYGLVSRTNMNLTKIENYAINFRACVRGIFDVFGATVSEDIQVLSAKGIWYCLKIVFVAVLVLVWIYNLVLLFRKNGQMNLKGFLVVLPLFNFLVLLISDSRYSSNPNIESVFFVDDPDTAHICGGIDEKHKYGIFMSETQSLESGICSYVESAQGSFYGGKNAVAVFIYSVPEDYMPAQIAEHYTKVGTVEWFDIYVSDSVWFP